MSNLKTTADNDLYMKINEIKLTLNSDTNKVFVLVEADDDVNTFSKFFITENVLFRPAGGRGNLREMMLTLKVLPRIIAIRDADFARFRGTEPEFDTMFFTDKHDIEMTMLFIPGVLTNALAVFGLEKKEGELLDSAMHSAEYVSYIRWFDAESKSGLKFDFGIASFFFKEKKSKQEFLQILNSRSKEKTREITEAEIESFISTHKTTDYYNLNNGHDVLSFLALCIGNDTSKKELPKLVRSSFQWRHFSQTDLYALLKTWQTKYGFCILKMAEDS